MKKQIRYGIFIGMITVMLVVGATFFHQPDETIDAGVVLSNMSEPEWMPFEISGVAVIFDVPVGPDYRINSVQLKMVGGGTVFVSIHADDDGFLGEEVIDLGQNDTPNPTAPLPFTPVGADVLTNGGRYWLYMTHLPQPVVWYAEDAPIAMNGVFTFVDNGYVDGNTLNSSIYGLLLTIDADPIGVPLIDESVNVGCVDGRLNSVCEGEAYQTATVYCKADGIDVYGIEDSAGWLAFHATQAEIDAVGIPSENTLIKASEDGTIRLYRLSTGEFQVNAPMWDEVRGNFPDGYVFKFEGCS